MTADLSNAIAPLARVEWRDDAVFACLDEHRSPVMVTHGGKERGIFLDVESYRRMINSLAMVKLLQISEQSSGGVTFSNDEVFAELRQKINSRDDKKI
jgi:hypothetical protein